MNALHAETEIAPIIGGFFEQHQPVSDAAGPSVLEAWTEGRPHAAFVNARSAFAALVAAHHRAVVWLPAFLCADLVQPQFAARTRFYPVGEGFEPDLTCVEAGGKAGDIVLVVAYFGQPLSARTRAIIARRSDLRVVEDRAQALGPDLDSGAHWQLYSPRKVLGVADGGLLIAGRPGVTLPRPGAPAPAGSLWEPARMRRADPMGRQNARWHGANQAKEAAMTVSWQGMTERSLAILSHTPLEPLVAARIRNWKALDWRLRRWSALPADPAAPPLGYVLRLPEIRRDRVLRALHAERIFAAVHWPRIAAPETDFPREARWTRDLITLPCDHRYDPADMARIATVVAGLLE